MSGKTMKNEKCFLCDVSLIFNDNHNRWYHVDGDRTYPWCEVAAPKKVKKKKKDKKK